MFIHYSQNMKYIKACSNVYVKLSNPPAKRSRKRKLPSRQETDSVVLSEKSSMTASAALNLKASSLIDVLSATEVPVYDGSETTVSPGNMQLPTVEILLNLCKTVVSDVRKTEIWFGFDF